ncbi:MAG: hypothetical protein LBD42_04690 [Desulfovibrio sp.]|jgi:hypothetical protein|nr:hypothetical protein [Desulfovibrio sp.]
MPGVSLQSNFTAGELSPSLSARVELSKYNTGCRTLKNFLVQSHGGAVKRPGFELLDALPGEAALVPFVFNREQSYCLCLGERWLRVAAHDGFILAGDGGPYEIESPYTLEQARQISYAQSADVLFIACHGVRPQKLKRLNHDHWEFEAMVFEAPLSPPVWSDYAANEDNAFQLAYPASSVYYVTGSGFGARYYLVGYNLYRKTDPAWIAVNHSLAYASGNAFTRGHDEEGNLTYFPINEDLYRRTGAALPVAFIHEARMSDGSDSPAQRTTSYTYHITALDAEGRESPMSAGASITGPASNNWQGADYIKLSWLGIEGAREYRVYKSVFGGRPGYVATTVDTAWQDHNVLPSISEGAPKYENPFPSDDFPGAVCLFEQRLVFASSLNRPQTIWMSKSGDYGNFAVYDPLAADSPIELTLAGGEISTANWMVSLRSMIMGTSGMEWEISGRGESAFSAMNKKATGQSYWGSSLKRAIVVGNVIVHVSSSGSQVRTLQYEFAADSYGGMDLSIMAAHLLEKERIVDWTYQKNPDSIIWAARSDGVLLGLTFQAEHQISAWHQHHTQGKFKAVCSVPHGFEDSLFAVVERDGIFFLERMAGRYKGGDPAGHVFADSAMTYNGEPTKIISGMEHMNGKSVCIMADGAVNAPRVVEGGMIELDHPASVVTVGLPYTADLETMPVEVVGGDGSSVAMKKQINAVDIIFRDSLGVKVGLSFDSAQDVRWRTNEPYGKPPAPFSGMKQIVTNKLAENILTVCLRSDLPTPVTVLAIVSRIAVNGR